MKQYFIYILTNKPYGTLYTGVTAYLPERIYQHKTKSIKGFSQKYDTTTLVYFEEFDNIGTATAREKQLKKWRRNWKIDLINKFNPEWKDLYYQL